MMTHRFSLALAAVALMTGAAPVWAADFGDAPDGAATGYPAPFQQTGAFPTLSANGGANVIDETLATLGPSSSAEADANDPNDSDGQPNLNPSNTDSDDGVTDFVVTLVSIPPPAQMRVNVSAPAGSPGGQYWINVLIDMNMNGRWDGVIAPNVNEWAVINFPVVLAAGQSQDVVLPSFLYGNGNRLPDGAWMRIALTDTMITEVDWSGGGQYASGEIEDHVLDLPEIADNKSCIPVMTCPKRVVMPAGAAAVPFNCAVNNVGRDPCTARYMLDEITPGADVAAAPPPGTACVPNGPNALNCAPTPAMPPAFMAAFTATRDGAGLPARWTYRAMAEDPPAVITPEGVIIGFGDSVGDVDFIGEPEEQEIQEKKPEPEQKAEPDPAPEKTEAGPAPETESKPQGKRSRPQEWKEPVPWKKPDLEEE